MWRVRIDMDDEDREQIREYAAKHNVRMPRAYIELIRIGLKHADDSDNDDE